MQKVTANYQPELLALNIRKSILMTLALTFSLIIFRQAIASKNIDIFNKITYLIEIKSSMSNADVYIFYKKAAFYVKKHKTKNIKLIVISPMIDDKAKKMAKKLNITAYSHGYDVKL